MMKYKAYLFDFDGTLVDSMPNYISAMLRVLDDCGARYESDIIKIITPLGYIGTAKYYIEHYGINLSEEEIVARMKQYAYDGYAYRIGAKKNVEKTLKMLKCEGASLNILTASPHEVLDICLSRLGLSDLFDNVWSCDDFHTGKSDPEIYRMATSRLGKPINEILFLDDNLGALKTARDAGMTVLGVYDESSDKYVEEIKSVSDYYIRDFSEIFTI